MPTILIASRNDHKAEEIGAILGDDFAILSLDAFPDAPPVIENGNSFAANATKKSREIATWLENQALGQSLPDYILADDSGLEVDALGGAPGIHSARYASGEKQGHAHDADNNAKLLREMVDVPEADRGAQFRCVLALTPLAQAIRTEVFEGICRGRISQAKAGGGGFG
ncbi:MAG TPA: non-canonical purine NTP pyrophosphatase, partial [Verrucomicrobiales bacterium]|nr:non-canonical purine NTP pyrophosphatase [Verrucomicrobiales bacterium]